MVSSVPENGEFVCSDNPVVLTWTKEVPTFYSPGFGMSSTEVKIPVTKQLALFARFEGEALCMTATEEYVAAVNAHVAWYADRFVYEAFAIAL